MHRADISFCRIVCVPALVFALGVVSGCGRGDGPDLGYVEGTVTMDDKPLPNAEVMFQPQAKPDDENLGGPSMATTDEDGHYSLQYTFQKKGAVVGPHLVKIRTGGTRYDEDDNEIHSPETVPARYNAKAEDNPEMNVEVESGSNTMDFKLTSDGEIIEPDDDDE